MAKRLTDEQVSRLLTTTERYLQVDGYYLRRDEVNVRGNLPGTAIDWEPDLRTELAALGYDCRQENDGAVVHLNLFPARRGLPWLNIVLFLATIVTVSIFPPLLLSGRAPSQIDLPLIVDWLQFAIPLLLILLFHEFGHYLAARRRGIRVTLPYFLPLPLGLGTLGAFIKMKSPMARRRDLLEVGAAGPLAGFVVAVIFLAVSLTNLTVQQVGQGPEMRGLVDPLIIKLLFQLVQTEPIPEGHAVILQQNQMLFAAWVGMVLTAINLLPAGQLDGGHIVYALFPRRHRRVSHLVFLLLLVSGLLWHGWWLWAVLLYFVIRFNHPPTLDDQVPLSWKSKALGWAAMIVFVLSFTPVPF